MLAKLVILEKGGGGGDSDLFLTKVQELILISSCVILPSVSTEQTHLLGRFFFFQRDKFAKCKHSQKLFFQT